MVAACHEKLSSLQDRRPMFELLGIEQRHVKRRPSSRALTWVSPPRPHTMPASLRVSEVVGSAARRAADRDALASSTTAIARPPGRAREAARPRRRALRRPSYRGECRRRTQVTRLIGITLARLAPISIPYHFRKCRQDSTSGHRLAGPDTTDVEPSVRRSGSKTVLQRREPSHDGRTPSVVELLEVANRDRLQILIGGTVSHELEIALIGEVDVRQGREKVLQRGRMSGYVRPGHSESLWSTACGIAFPQVVFLSGRLNGRPCPTQRR